MYILNQQQTRRGINTITTDVWVEEDHNDLCQTLNKSQFLLRGQKQDAEKAISVLGTANASFETVTWKRTIDQVKPYVDYIVTVN